MNTKLILSGILRRYAKFRLEKKFKKEAVIGSYFIREYTFSKETKFPWNSCNGMVIVDVHDTTNNKGDIKFHWKDYYSVTAITLEEFNKFRETGECYFLTEMLITFSILKEHYDYRGPSKESIKTDLQKQYDIYRKKYHISLSKPILTCQLPNATYWRKLSKEEAIDQIEHLTIRLNKLIDEQKN